MNFFLLNLALIIRHHADVYTKFLILVTFLNLALIIRHHADVYTKFLILVAFLNLALIIRHHADVYYTKFLILVTFLNLALTYDIMLNFIFYDISIKKVKVAVLTHNYIPKNAKTQISV